MIKPDLTGKRYGRLTVKHLLNERKNKKRVWQCVCDCGNEINVITEALQCGDTQSCGCLKKNIETINLRTKFDDKRVDGVALPLLTAKVRKDSTTRVKGVSPKKNKSGTISYNAYITIKGKRINLGTRTTIEEAAELRRKAEIKYIDPLINKTKKPSN